MVYPDGSAEAGIVTAATANAASTAAPRFLVRMTFLPCCTFLQFQRIAETGKG